MSVNVGEVFQRGGRELIDLLEYCVISVNTDALFLYLAREYQLQPTAAKAVALYDSFCAFDAAARISSEFALPPKDMRIALAIEPYRRNGPKQDRLPTKNGKEVDDNDQEPTAPPMPPKYLFDFVIQELSSGLDSGSGQVWQAYDPGLSPHENLPNGQMNASQRAFVDNVWQPRVRPKLVHAGFWRIAAIG